MLLVPKGTIGCKHLAPMRPSKGSFKKDITKDCFSVSIWKTLTDNETYDQQKEIEDVYYSDRVTWLNEI